MRIILLTSLLLLLVSRGFSQTSEKAHHQALLTELQGVYQIQLENPRLKPMITTELLESVKANQKQNQTATFDYGIMRIVVKSKNDVQNGNLFPEHQFVVKRED
jgi:hypothetical protein